MREEEIEMLSKPYDSKARTEVNLFDVAIGASLPSANRLSKHILNDLDPGWTNWADQYRNMFVHRGRRASYHQLIPRDQVLFDFTGKRILRVASRTHVARFPDRSEIEAMLKDKDVLLNEIAESTLTGIFNSCRELEELICARLRLIWEVRRNHPSIIIQPVDQWKIKTKPSTFAGYEPDMQPFDADQLTINQILAHRMRAAAGDDAHRSLWSNSVWAN